MEDTLRGIVRNPKNNNLFVLILVLMEDTLRVLMEIVSSMPQVSLNPCFNGRYSQRG